MDGMSPPDSIEPVYQRIRDIVIQGRTNALQAASKEMVRAYQMAGFEIADQDNELFQPDNLAKNPFLLDFLGLRPLADLPIPDLKEALLDALQAFLLTEGRELCLAARRKRITVDGDHFCIDLVFYHRTLRCFLLIDLKTGPLTHQDIGQMLLCTGYYEAEEMREGENPPVGLILCTDENDTVVRYTLGEATQHVFASRYKFHLPSEEELQKELRLERARIEQERRLQE